MIRTALAPCLAGLLALAAGPALADAHTGLPSFFLTSAGPGEGGDLGGLPGADAHCTALADVAELPAGTWVAYLSSADENARDRIGAGPWYNVKGEMIAEGVEALHGGTNGLSKAATLSEAGDVINGRGDTPNRHDVLTGSNLDGTLMEGQTCEDWTSSADDASARVGHHDLTGGGEHPESFNSAHASQGCSPEALRETGGDGLFYCFRAD